MLALLNNDLVLRPGWLRPMLRALDSLGPRAGMVGNIQLNAATGKVDHAGIYFNRKCKPEHDRRDPGRLTSLLFPIRRWRRPSPGALRPRAEAPPGKGLGRFDESFVDECEDMDLCFRASSRGLVNAVAPRSRVLHHVERVAGRKLRDEELPLRLVEEALASRHPDRLLGSRRWAWRYYRPFFAEDPRDLPDPVEALHVEASTWQGPQLQGRRQGAVAAMNQHDRQELAHWRK